MGRPDGLVEAESSTILSLFKRSKHILVDDTDRSAERGLADSIARIDQWVY